MFFNLWHDERIDLIINTLHLLGKHWNHYLFQLVLDKGLDPLFNWFLNECLNLQLLDLLSLDLLLKLVEFLGQVLVFFSQFLKVFYDLVLLLCRFVLFDSLRSTLLLLYGLIRGGESWSISSVFFLHNNYFFLLLLESFPLFFRQFLLRFLSNLTLLFVILSNACFFFRIKLFLCFTDALG